MEALLKEGGGGDHIAVGVKLPSGAFQRPISQEDVYIRPPGMMEVDAGYAEMERERRNNVIAYC